MRREATMTARANSRDATPRAGAWIASSLLAFLPAQVVALLAADRLASALGVGFPEREVVVFTAVLGGGLLMLAIVPLAGRSLECVDRFWAGWRLAAPMLLAAFVAYVLVADVRSGAVFETDHALPDILLPYAVVLLASGAIGHRAARERSARTGWTWVIRAAAALVAILIALAAAKMATDGGDFALDSPMTVATLATIGAYAVVAVLRAR
jgi:hypothetical protein